MDSVPQDAPKGLPLKEMTTTILRGDYQQVNLIRGTASVLCDHSASYEMYGWSAKVKGALIGKGQAVSEAVTDATLSHNIIHHQGIRESDLARFPRDVSDMSQVTFANAWGAIVWEYNQAALAKKIQTRRLGLILSDFLQVIPRDLAARFLYSAGNPDVAAVIMEGKGLKILKGIDLLPTSVEAIVLLPGEVRREIWKELAKLKPGTEGRASRLISQVASNFNQRTSDYNAQRLIYANLKDEQAQAKLTEVMGQLSVLREIVKSTT